MQNVNIKSACLLLTAAILASLCLAGCGDKPNQPKPVKDYVFYFNDGGYYDRYYAYHTATGKVDSFAIPYESRKGFAVSADGRRLYLPDGTQTVVVSTDSFQVVTEINYNSFGGVAVSPDNQLVAIQGKDGLYILNTSDYSVVYHDTIGVARGVFSHDCRYFYSAGGGGVYRVGLYDTLFTVTTKSFPYMIWKIVPSHNEVKWLLLVRYDQCLWSFEVYDASLDSIVFRDSLFLYGYGDMILTPDGRFLFYTMPGTPLELCPGAPHSAFTVFDVHRNGIHQIVNTAGIGKTNGFFPIGNLAMTPDGRKLIAGRGPVGGEFIVLDVRTLQIEEYFDLGNEVWLWNVTCQNGL